MRNGFKTQELEVQIPVMVDALAEQVEAGEAQAEASEAALVEAETAMVARAWVRPKRLRRMPLKPSPHDSGLGAGWVNEQGRDEVQTSLILHQIIPMEPTRAPRPKRLRRTPL